MAAGTRQTGQGGCRQDGREQCAGNRKGFFSASLLATAHALPSGFAVRRLRGLGRGGGGGRAISMPTVGLGHMFVGTSRIERQDSSRGYVRFTHMPL